MGGQETVEVTHEALIDHWQLLQDWLDEGRDDLRFQRRLEEAVLHWDSQNRPSGLLWRRPDLDLLRDYYQRFRHQMTALQLAFFRAATWQERQQKVWRGAGVGALALLAAGMTWFGIQSRRAEQLALGRQLAAQAEQLVNQSSVPHQEAGALLAVRAFRTVHVTGRELGSVNQALRQSLGKLPFATLNHEGEVWAVSFSADGQRVATASGDNTARIHWLWSKDLAAEICSRLHRNFSASEWANYVQTDLSQYTLTCPNRPVHPSVLEAIHAEAKAGNVNKATQLLRRMLRISQSAGHDIDLDPATEAQAQDPRAVALKYSAVHWVREATSLARAGNTPKAISLFEKALSYDPEIDLNPATEDLEQDPKAVAQALANATSDD